MTHYNFYLAMRSLHFLCLNFIFVCSASFSYFIYFEFAIYSAHFTNRNPVKSWLHIYMNFHFGDFLSVYILEDLVSLFLHMLFLSSIVATSFSFV